jgi:hypothetical protein
MGAQPAQAAPSLTAVFAVSRLFLSVNRGLLNPPGIDAMAAKLFW